MVSPPLALPACLVIYFGFGEKKTHVRFCSNELACRNVDNF
jgi:hypothetical protein